MATFANRFRVYAYGDVVRIMFEDAIEGKEGIVETQIVMRTSDAEVLSKVLMETIQQRKNKPPA